MSRKYSEFKNDETEKNLLSVWKAFEAEFPTDDECWQEIYSRLHRIDCHECGSEKLTATTNCRTMRCTNCNSFVWITAGTFFNRVRRPRAWLAALYLLEEGISISAHRFHQLVKISVTGAAQIFKKISLLISNLAINPKNYSELESPGFTPVLVRRSKETDAWRHPSIFDRASIDSQITPPRMPFADKNSATNLFETMLTTDSQLAIYDYLAETPAKSARSAHIDELCAHIGINVADASVAITLMEIDGIIERLPGGRFRIKTVFSSQLRPNNPKHSEGNMDDSQKSLLRFIEYIKTIFHGISRRYLQLYLVLFWIKLDRKRWSKGKLRNICINSPFIHDEELNSFVSPFIVTIVNE